MMLSRVKIYIPLLFDKHPPFYTPSFSSLIISADMLTADILALNGSRVTADVVLTASSEIQALSLSGLLLLIVDMLIASSKTLAGTM